MRKFKKIAILRVNALGDFIFALPAINALRNTFPRAEIVYLGKDWHRAFLEKRKEVVDRVIVVPKARGVGEGENYINKKGEIESFFERMKKENFDLAIQMHGGGLYSNPFLKGLGAKMTLGMKTPSAEDLDLTIPYYIYQNEYARYLEVVSLVGARTLKVNPFLKPLQTDISEAENALGKKSKRFAVIHPGATDIRRRWSFKRFSQVGNFLVKQGLRVVVTGVYEEKKLVEKVVNNMKEPADAFVEKVSLNGLAGLLALAKIVVSNDSGPLHLANALGTKSIGLFWCGNMINAAPLFRKKRVCLASWINICSICGEKIAEQAPFKREAERCQHKTSFINGVKVSEVITEIQKLLRQP